MYFYRFYPQPGGRQPGHLGDVLTLSRVYRHNYVWRFFFAELGSPTKEISPDWAGNRCELGQATRDLLALANDPQLSS